MRPEYGLGQGKMVEVGDKVKFNWRIGNKLTPKLCEEKIFKADLGTTILIKERGVHRVCFFLVMYFLHNFLLFYSIYLLYWVASMIRACECNRGNMSFFL